MERFPVPQRLTRPFRDDVPDQALAAGLVFQEPHHGVPDAPVLAQHPFDLTELDPVTVQLDLVIDPTAELDRPIGEVPRHVTGAIQPSATILIERIRYEFLGRQLRALQVPPPHPGAADAELTSLALGHRLPGGVEDVHVGVGQRSPQGERAGARRRQVGADVIGQRPDGGLGGTVMVVDLARRRLGAQPLDPVQPGRLATEDQAGSGHDLLRIVAGLQCRQM
jgi:hypothetical protein